MNASDQLKKTVGLYGAILLGLGSIIGTGIFIGSGLAVGLAGVWVLPAIVLAALVALCNGLSSAQLAASHPVSGGTYEYGYRYLNPWLGFSAGWLFLCAKATSAATAALGFAAYLIQMLSINSELKLPIAMLTIALLTVVVLLGLKRSNQVNTIVVGITLCSLLLFVALACISAPPKYTSQSEIASPLDQTFYDHVRHFFFATALIFVAYTGYGRIATLGEEVEEPRRTIPRAIFWTLGISMLLYVAVVGAGLYAAGIAGFISDPGAPSPLYRILQQLNHPFGACLVAIGACTAMLGVLLNLILGLSRVLLAMGRRGDMPAPVAFLNRTRTTPYVSVLVIGLLLLVLVCIGDIRMTWGFSAFSVLVYYALTNLAALQLPPPERLYPSYIAWLGLSSCLLLAVFVEWKLLLAGSGLITVGLLWHMTAHCIRRRRRLEPPAAE